MPLTHTTLGEIKKFELFRFIDDEDYPDEVVIRMKGSLIFKVVVEYANKTGTRTERLSLVPEAIK